ncbi:GNAT family N-acetyltransferase [Marivita sp. S2033]|uniref:GNAT family N-acetyltransferase n=1 Tax=Marivita sp. S2033 TaxID=3373187 RepID=UPI0039829FE2
MTAHALRPASTLDAGGIGAILSNWIDTTGWLPRVHSRAENIAHAAVMVERGWVVVAECNNGISGFLARHGRDIHALYIDAAARGQGIGTQLLKHAMDCSDRLELWTYQQNLSAQRFYERHGFLETARTDGAGNDEGLPDIRYRWQRTTP